MGIKPSRSKQLMVESDESVFAKELLGRDYKTFIGLPRTQYHIDMIGVLLMGIKPSRSKQLMVESDESVFAKELLGRDNKTFIGLPCTQYHISWSAGERYWTTIVRYPISSSS